MRLAGLAAIALAIRILPATVNFVIGTDEALYLTLARNLAAGLGFTADGVTPHTEFAPLYPIFAAGVYRLGGGLELPARLNILLFGSLLVAPVWGLARDMHGGSVAAKAAALTALLPALALAVPNWEAPTEQLYSVLLWAGWWALWRAWRKPALANGILAGLLLGLAHVTRIEGLYYAVAGAMLLAMRALKNGHWRLVIGFVGAAAACVAPYSLYVHMNTGLWLAPKGVLHQYHGAALASDDPLAYEAAYEDYEANLRQLRELPSMPRYYWEHRAEMPGIYVRNLARQALLALRSPLMLAILWLPLALVGVWTLGRREGGGRQLAFLALALGPALIYPLSVVDPRYLLPLLPAGMIWAAVGVQSSVVSSQSSVVSSQSSVVSSQSSAVRLPSVASLSFGVWSLRFGFGRLIFGVWILAFVALDLAAPFFIPRPVEYKALGEWMRANGIGAGETVLARKRQVPFYAGAQWDWLPFAGLDGLLARAHARGAQYVVIDARTVPSLRPQLAFLLDPTQAPAALEPVHVEDQGMRIVLYRIVGAPP